jgi:hypothetical protein
MASLAVLQFIIIAFLVYYSLSLRKKIKNPVPDENASELLQRLLKGGAVVVTQIIDPESLFLHSPRAKK